MFGDMPRPVEGSGTLTPITLVENYQFTSRRAMGTGSPAQAGYSSGGNKFRVYSKGYTQLQYSISLTDCSLDSIVITDSGQSYTYTATTQTLDITNYDYSSKDYIEIETNSTSTSLSAYWSYVIVEIVLS